MITSLFSMLTPMFAQLPIAARFPSDAQAWFVLVLPLAGMALGAIAIIGGLWFTDRNRRMRHETIRLALEKGQPIPESFLNEDEHGRQRRKGPRNDRRTGLILLGVAAGIYLSLRGVGGDGAEWFAAIPGLIGLALLLNAMFDRISGPPTPPPAA